jgi:hypothetical protein
MLRSVFHILFVIILMIVIIFVGKDQPMLGTSFIASKFGACDTSDHTILSLDTKKIYKRSNNIAM